MKDFDGDVKIKKSTLTATGVKIESIDSNPIEVVAEVRKSTEQEHELVVIFIKNGISMSAESDLAGYTAAKSIVRNFANEMSKEATEDYLKEQNKLVEDLVKDLEGAEKDHEKATKEIQDAKENIENAKKEIKEAEAKIKEKSKFIDDNKKTKEELSK
jgi:peptidoglycan hydrolase CwlO-like protein